MKSAKSRRCSIIFIISGSVVTVGEEILQSLEKFALVGCFSSKNWYSFTPLFATLENSNIIQNYDVFILKKRKIIAIKRLLNQYKVLVLAYSFYTHEASSIALEIKNLRKEISQNSLILLAGGSHASGNPKQTLQMGFDLVAKGEGEKIFPTLLEHIYNNQGFEDIQGISFWKNGIIQTNPQPELIHLDEYPTFSVKYSLYPPIEITRGCPFGCKYCGVTYLFGNKMRHRSIDTIIKIVGSYKKIFAGRRNTDIRFISPNSFAYGSLDGKSPNVKKIHELLRSIHDLKDIRIFFATFPSETRPEFITSSILEMIKPYISNNQIAFGAQSGSDRILNLIGRNHTVQDIQNANQIILDAGLNPLVDFILGIPGETAEDQYLTLDLIKELIQSKAKIRIHYFMPLAGTPFENASSVTIIPPILSEIGRLAKKGYLEGNLDAQIKNSIRIQNFLKSSKAV